MPVIKFPKCVICGDPDPHVCQICGLFVCFECEVKDDRGPHEHKPYDQVGNNWQKEDTEC